MARTRPSIRREAYDIYWRFAAERQLIFQRRIAGRPGPWTDDPILQEYKFCNTFRAADRVSQYMIRNVCYNTQSDSPADRLFQIVAFRTFSKPSLWEYLVQGLGRAPRIEDLENGDLRQLLDAARRDGRKLYTAAFILCANDAYGQQVKHRNHVALFHDMFVLNELGDRIQEAGSLEAVYDLLHEFPLMGDFMSYQTAIDINYSAVVNFSENDFTKPGPGAIRGLSKAFTDLGDYTPEEVIAGMVERQFDEFERLGLDFKGLWGRDLHAIDCQGLFCELDKYTRVALPHLLSNRSRIKVKFQQTGEALNLFFPPKWRINDRLPKEAVLGPIATA